MSKKMIKKTLSRAESDELIEDLTLNPYEVNESFRRGLNLEGNNYLEKIEKIVMENEKDIPNKNQKNFIKFFDNLNRKVTSKKNYDSPIEILTECERFGFDTETLLRLGTIVIESSPKTQQQQQHHSTQHAHAHDSDTEVVYDEELEVPFIRGVSDRSDDRYADDDFEEYTGDDVTEGIEDDSGRVTITPASSSGSTKGARAQTAQGLVAVPTAATATPPHEIIQTKGPRSMSAPVPALAPLDLLPFHEKPHKSQMKLTHRQAGWIKRGEWRLGSRIGSGSFGEVYQGMSDDGLLFAVKKMNIVPNKETANLASEIELMRVLDHPNIVKYLGVKVDEHASVIYIFQEWVPGGSVEKLLQNYGVFSIGVIRNYTRQILCGLEYLHANGIVHRDIKGGNILVDESTVKLADFGASTTISLGETEELSTIAGTPYFMAPEVFVSKYGRRGDVWAVGCTIIQMLTGDPPWKDRKLHSIVQLHVLLSTWVGIPPLKREIPEDLRSFLELCFEKNPKNRPMAEELLRHHFLVDVYEDKIDSLGSTSGIDIREQLERAARAIFHNPDEDSEDIQGTTRRPQKIVDSPRIPDSNGVMPSTPYLQPFKSEYPSPVPKHRHSSHESNSSNSSGPSPHNPFAKKSIGTPSPNNPFGRNSSRASTNSISPQAAATTAAAGARGVGGGIGGGGVRGGTGGMVPSASENSFLKPPATSAGLPPKQQQQARYEPLPMAKIKAWSPSDVGNDDEYEQQQQQQQQRRSDRNRNHRSSEVDDSLQYSDNSQHHNHQQHSTGAATGGGGRRISGSGGGDDDNYSQDHYTDEEDEHEEDNDNDSVEDETSQQHDPYPSAHHNDRSRGLVGQGQGQQQQQQKTRETVMERRQQQQQQPRTNGQSNHSTPIYPELPTPTAVRGKEGPPQPRRPSKEIIEFPSPVSTPPALSKRSKKQSQPQQQQPSSNIRIPPLAPHPSQYDPHHHHHQQQQQSDENSARKNLNKVYSTQSSSEGSETQGQGRERGHGAAGRGGGGGTSSARRVSNEIKPKHRPKALSDIPPLASQSQQQPQSQHLQQQPPQRRDKLSNLNPALSKSSLHPPVASRGMLPEDKKMSHQSSSSSSNSSSRASSASSAITGKKKWRCTNKNCVHINYEQDNYCSNCGASKKISAS